MPAKREIVERLDLTFRAEPASGSRNALPGGWLLCCLIGTAVGISCWLVGRQQLALSLTSQLADSSTTAEAMLAVEGLLMLDADASLEIVRGLENSKLEIARTAYRTLDAQITRWQALEPTIGMARMQTLAERLRQLPPNTPTDNLVLASSLASRIFSICLAKDDPQLRPLMRICESIFQRVGESRSDVESDEQKLEVNLASLVPPTVSTESRPRAEPQFTAPVATPVDGLAPLDSPLGSGRLEEGEAADGALRAATKPPMATMRLINDRTRPRAARSTLSDNVNSEVEFDQLSLVEPEPEPVPESDALPTTRGVDSAENVNKMELPMIVSVPATLSTTPLAHMQIATDQVDLDGIQDLEIEQLVRLLASLQPRIAQAAALALRAKGMDDTKLELASELARGSAARRLELVEWIASNGNFEPRPWLLWMAEDGEPEVRKLCVSLLSSMLDSDVERSLRILLARERELDVEQAIREALLVRGNR